MCHHEELEAARDELAAALEKARNDVDLNTPAMRSTIDSALDEHTAELNGMLGALHQGDFLDPTASAAAVLVRLVAMEERLSAIASHSDQMHGHQRALDLPTDEFVALHQMRVSHDAKRDLRSVADR